MLNPLKAFLEWTRVVLSNFNLSKTWQNLYSNPNVLNHNFNFMFNIRCLKFPDPLYLYTTALTCFLIIGCQRLGDTSRFGWKDRFRRRWKSRKWNRKSENSSSISFLRVNRTQNYKKKLPPNKSSHNKRLKPPRVVMRPPSAISSMADCHG